MLLYGSEPRVRRGALTEPHLNNYVVHIHISHTIILTVTKQQEQLLQLKNYPKIWEVTSSPCYLLMMA